MQFQDIEYRLSLLEALFIAIYLVSRTALALWSYGYQDNRVGTGISSVRSQYYWHHNIGHTCMYCIGTGEDFKMYIESGYPTNLISTIKLQLGSCPWCRHGRGRGRGMYAMCIAHSPAQALINRPSGIKEGF